MRTSHIIRDLMIGIAFAVLMTIAFTHSTAACSWETSDRC
jgi:hypothetical protein